MGHRISTGCLEQNWIKHALVNMAVEKNTVCQNWNIFLQYTLAQRQNFKQEILFKWAIPGDEICSYLFLKNIFSNFD